MCVIPCCIYKSKSVLTDINLESRDHEKQSLKSVHNTSEKNILDLTLHCPKHFTQSQSLDFFQPFYGYYIIENVGFGSFMADRWFKRCWCLDSLGLCDLKPEDLLVFSLQVMFLLFLAVEHLRIASVAQFSLNHLRFSRILPSRCPPVPPPCRCLTPPLWQSACLGRNTGSWCCSAPCTTRTPAAMEARPRTGDVQNGCRGYRRMAGTPALSTVQRQRWERLGCASSAVRPTSAAPPRAPGAWRCWSSSSPSSWSGGNRALYHRGRSRRKTWLLICTGTRHFCPPGSLRCSVCAGRAVCGTSWSSAFFSVQPTCRGLSWLKR